MKNRIWIEAAVLKPLQKNVSGNRSIVVVGRVLLAGLLLSCAGSVLAQTAAKEIPASGEFYHQVWQIEDGLPNNDVHAVFPTPDGFLWVGTRRGLVRFDGAHFDSIQTSNGLNLAQSWVWRMGAYSNGLVLMAFKDSGMAVGGSGSFQAIKVNGETYSQEVKSFCTDKVGRIWTVSSEGWVVRLSNSVAQPFGILGKGAVGESTIVTDNAGTVWLASKGSIGYFRGDDFVRVAEDIVSVLLISSPHGRGVWLVTLEGLFRVEKDQVITEIARFPWPSSECIIRAGLEDRNGTLWLGTSRKGLFRFSNGQFESVATSHQNILCLTEDRAGNLWVGTQGGGLDRISPRQFTVLAAQQGLPNDSVLSFAEDTAGRVWIAGQDGGLCHWSNGVIKVLGPAEGWANLPIICLTADPQGGIWIGSLRNGLLHWANGQLINTSLELGLKTTFLRCLQVDSSGRLWAGGSPEGLLCVEGGRVKVYTTKDGLPGTDVRCLAADKSGGVWMGTEEGELGLLSEGAFQKFTHPHWPGDGIHALLVAPDGAVWLGTVGQGLLRFQNGIFTQVKSTHGLPTDSISQLLLDQAGWLWCGSDRGLFRVKLAELNAAADGKLAEVTAFHYGRSVGLSDFQFCDDDQPAAIVDRTGQFWLASVKGAVVFRPGALTYDSEPPSVFIESISSNGKPLNASSAAALPAGVRRLEFRFVAPDLTGSENVRYRFKLDGTKADWSAAAPTPMAVYTNLPPGRYRFQVIACNSDGVWNEKGVSLAFTVVPFYWQTDWFRYLAIAVAAGSLLLIGRYVAVRRLRRRLWILKQEGELQRERTRIAQDIHDELGANLTSISWLADRGQKHQADPAVVGAELEKIAATARESVRAMDGIVWALNQHNESLENFADYLSHFANEFFRPTAISCQLEIPLRIPEIKMGTVARHHLFLAVKEALNNVLRHSEASEVWIRLHCGDDQLVISVADNGKGLNLNAGKPGEDGLANIRSRIAALKGTLSLTSGTDNLEEGFADGAERELGSKGKAGGGTCVRFTVPLAGLK